MAVNSIPLPVTAVHDQLATWFTEYQLLIFRHLHQLVADEDLANDLLQETFMRALTTLKADEAPRNPRAWLCRIATNLALDHLRQRARRRWWLLSRPQHGSPEQSVETTALIRGCFARMSQREAEVLVMTHYLGFSPQEIASLLGENLSTVGVRLHRARQRFRVLYHKETTNELS